MGDKYVDARARFSADDFTVYSTGPRNLGARWLLFPHSAHMRRFAGFLAGTQQELPRISMRGMAHRACRRDT